MGLASSVDITTAKYIPSSRVQMGRQEIIADLEAMVNVCDAAFYSKSANLMAAVGGTQRWLFK